MRVGGAILAAGLLVACSSSSGTSAPDASAPIGGADASRPPDDAAVNDAGSGDAAPTVCAPADESSFTPMWRPPRPPVTACTQAQIHAYRQCLDDSQTSATPASCAPFTGTAVSPADKACLQCILSPEAATTYGPLIIHPGTIEVNVPGCIALATGDSSTAGCGAKDQAAIACRLMACGAACPVTDQASFAREQACEEKALAGTCKTYGDAAACASALVEAGAAGATCLGGATFDERYDAIVPLFCGGSGGDAATDGP
jgi:hypothetical protein